MIASAYPGYASGQSATMLQVLNSSTDDMELGRQAVVSLLNAHQNQFKAPPYPLSPAEVIDIFNQVWRNGQYKVNSTATWNRGQVIAYLKGLNGAP